MTSTHPHGSPFFLAMLMFLPFALVLKYHQEQQRQPSVVPAPEVTVHVPEPPSPLNERARAGRYFCLETAGGDLYISKDHVVAWRVESAAGFVVLIIDSASGTFRMPIHGPPDLSMDELMEQVRSAVLDGLDGPIPVYQKLATEVH